MPSLFIGFSQSFQYLVVILLIVNSRRLSQSFPQAAATYDSFQSH